MKNNRKKIEKFCKNMGLKILNLEFYRQTGYIYGDPTNESEWILRVKKDNFVSEKTSFKGNLTVAEDVDEMLKELREDIETGLYEEIWEIDEENTPPIELSGDKV